MIGARSQAFGAAGGRGRARAASRRRARRPGAAPGGRRGRRRGSRFGGASAHASSSVEPPQLHQRVLAHVGDAVVAARLLVVLAQRVAHPVVGQQDAAQVGVAGEGHAEEVVAPRAPASWPPSRPPRPSGTTGAGAVGVHLEHHPVPVAVGEEVVDDLDDVPLRPVDGGQVSQAVELEPGRLLQEARRPRRCDRPLHHGERVELRLGERPDRVAEAPPPAWRGSPAGSSGLRLRRRAAGPPAAAVAPALVPALRCTSSCSFRSPSVSASGRGGQPGT